MLIDTHCHLDFPELDGDIPGVRARAHEAGVGRMITISTRVKKYDIYRAIAEVNDNVWFTVGTHPHQAHEEPDVTVADLVGLASHPRCVAIGEAGLDYHYDKSPRDIAARVFRTHIAAARQTGLPLVIHSRDADADMAAILEDEAGQGAFPFLLHCFSSGADLARLAVRLGGYVSFSGMLTFPKSDAIRAVAAETPADRLLVETDSPYLAPVPFRGKRCEPGYVVHTAARLAEVRGLGIAALAELTTGNFHRLFTRARAG